MSKNPYLSLSHSWGKSAKQKAAEKEYNRKYYQEHKDKWKKYNESDGRSMSSYPASRTVYRDTGKTGTTKRGTGLGASSPLNVSDSRTVSVSDSNSSIAKAKTAYATAMKAYTKDPSPQNEKVVAYWKNKVQTLNAINENPSEVSSNLAKAKTAYATAMKAYTKDPSPQNEKVVAYWKNKVQTLKQANAASEATIERTKKRKASEQARASSMAANEQARQAASEATIERTKKRKASEQARASSMAANEQARQAASEAKTTDYKQKVAIERARNRLAAAKAIFPANPTMEDRANLYKLQKEYERLVKNSK